MVFDCFLLFAKVFFLFPLSALVFYSFSYVSMNGFSRPGVEIGAGLDGFSWPGADLAILGWLQLARPIETTRKFLTVAR